MRSIFKALLYTTVMLANDSCDAVHLAFIHFIIVMTMITLLKENHLSVNFLGKEMSFSFHSRIHIRAVDFMTCFTLEK